jgi:Protein of unknown function (DUF3363)
MRTPQPQLLAARSDLPIEAQVTANGATWLDTRLLAREPVSTGGGFGAEVQDPMEGRVEYLVSSWTRRAICYFSTKAI